MCTFDLVCTSNNHMHACNTNNLISFIFLRAQILQVINPQCSYSVADNNIRGVALILKDLIQALDKYGIEHENESSDGRSDVNTTATQLFLLSLNIDIKNCHPKSCVLIPRGDVTSELLDGKLEGTLISRCPEKRTRFRNLNWISGFL